MNVITTIANSQIEKSKNKNNVLSQKHAIFVVFHEMSTVLLSTIYSIPNYADTNFYLSDIYLS